MMIPFHSSAMSSSSCHHWLWLDIIIPDVKGSLPGAQVVDTSKRSDQKRMIIVVRGYEGRRCSHLIRKNLILSLLQVSFLSLPRKKGAGII